jgi:ligand-binding SRPBCC domain-containing protein
MNLFLTTRISAPLTHIEENFNRTLFAYLNPPGAKVEIVRFDGTKKGDILVLKLKTPIMKGEWHGSIIERFSDQKQFYFIDVGDELPWPLKSWRHKHLVEKIDQNSCLLSDDVNFSTPSALLDRLFYPFFWGMFFWRRHRYQKYFTQVVKFKK